RSSSINSRALSPDLLKLISTFAPADASERDIASPIPRAPPVTSTVFPDKFICIASTGIFSHHNGRNLAAEAERVGQSGPDPYRAADKGHVVQVALRVWVCQVDCRVNSVPRNRKCGENKLRTPG